MRGAFEAALAALAAQVIEGQVLGGLVEKRAQVLDMPALRGLGHAQVGLPAPLRVSPEKSAGMVAVDKNISQLRFLCVGQARINQWDCRKCLIVDA